MDEAGDEMGEGLLVVAAPLVEGSAPSSPMNGEGKDIDFGKAESNKGDGDSAKVSLGSDHASERDVT